MNEQPIIATPRLSEAASSVVCRLLREPVASTRRLPHGVMTYKFVVQLASGEAYVVRFYPPARQWVIEFEPDLLRRCRSAGARTPEVVADSRTGPPADLNYVIYRLIPGKPLSSCYNQLSARMKCDLIEAVVEQIVLLHLLPMQGFGGLRDAERATSDSWEAFLTHSIRRGLACLKAQKGLAPEYIQKLERILRHLDSLWVDATPGLIWADVKLDNILVDQHQRFAGLLDFESCLSGDSLVNLGYCFASYGDHSFSQLLVQAWPDPLDDHARRRLYLYAILRAMRLAPHLRQELPTGRRRLPLEVILPGFHHAILSLDDMLI